MPAAAAWMIRLAFGYLAAGFVLGAVMLGAGLRTPPMILIHGEWLLWGWMLQLAFGVAAWILPKSPQRREWTAVWVALVLLNVGLVVVTMGGAAQQPLSVAAGRSLLLASAAVFAAYIWPRIRSFREKMVKPRAKR